MNLNEFLEELNKIKEEHGGDLEIVYASDEEGNSFAPPTFKPMPGYYDGENFDSSNEEPNAVCVN